MFDASGFACGPCRATRTQFGGGGRVGLDGIRTLAACVLPEMFCYV